MKLDDARRAELMEVINCYDTYLPPHACLSLHAAIVATLERRTNVEIAADLQLALYRQHGFDNALLLHEAVEALRNSERKP